MSVNGRIQTGAYSNIPKKVFTLRTPNMMKKSNIFLANDEVIKLIMQGMPSPLTVYNGQNKRAQITKRIDDSDYMINLMVSSFTEKALSARVIKTLIIIFNKNKHQTEEEGVMFSWILV